MIVADLTISVNDLSKTEIDLSPLRDSIGPISVSVRRRLRQRTDLEVTTYAKNQTEVIYTIMPLEELSENVLVQPVYVLVTEYGNLINGFYKLQNVRREPVIGSYYVEEVTFELVYVGNANTHIRGFGLSDLETVSNDWGI